MAFGSPTPSFTPAKFSKRSSGGFGAAANMVDLAGPYQALRRKAPNYGSMYGTNMANRANERAGMLEAESAIRAQGLQSMAAIKRADILADAQVKAANAAAAGASQGATMGAIGNIIGAGLMMFSDKDTKENINSIDDALTLLRQLKPVSFNYIPEFSTSPERLHYGFIAQEYKETMPDATYYDESTQKLCIDPVELIGLLVRAIQQLETRVARMEAANALVGVAS